MNQLVLLSFCIFIVLKGYCFSDLEGYFHWGYNSRLAFISSHRIEEVVKISSGIITADRSTLCLTVAHLKGIYLFSLATFNKLFSFTMVFCSFTTVCLAETSFYLA